MNINTLTCTAKNNYKSNNKGNRARKITCFLCKREIKGKYKLLNYKNTCVKVCTNCNSKTHKACKLKYKGKFLDCSICNKAVLYNQSILCQNCDCFVHQKCTKLSNAGIKAIENSIDFWTCSKCMAGIYPFADLDTQQLACAINPSTKKIVKKKRLYFSKQQCLACKNYIPRKKYKNKSIIYNGNYAKLCPDCSIPGNNKLRDQTLIEYLDCSYCMKEVKHESVLCSICQHWTDADCAKLDKMDLNKINDHAYGDWFCYSCVSSIFPMMETHDFDIKESTNNFQKFLDCSVCTKNVTGQSLCCFMCSHWVHKRCIDKFSNKRYNSKNSTVPSVQSFDYMNTFYKNRDWFCPKCSESIFPLIGVDDDEFMAICYSSQYTMTKNIEKICKNLIKIDAFDS